MRRRQKGIRMLVIKTGRRWLNLEYLIMAEEGEAGCAVPPGSVRVTMLTGKEFDLTGPDADRFREGATRAVRVEPRSRPGPVTKSVRVDPDAGATGLVPVPPDKRKQGR